MESHLRGIPHGQEIKMSEQGEENKDFTEDELKILGEVEEPEVTESETEVETEAAGEAEAETETEEAVDTESAPAKAAESEPEHGTDKVQKRIDTLTIEKKTAQEKLDLFKRLGADGYYKLYPDETPETIEKPKAPIPGELPKEITDIRTIEVEGGDFDGKTFGQVFDTDPRAAYQLDPYYARKLDDHKQAQEAEKTQRFEKIKQAEVERIDKFASALSTEIFEVDDPDKLTKEQQGQLSGKIEQVMDWMSETGRLHYNIDDAYQIMTSGKRIGEAQTNGAKSVIDKLSRPVRSIGTGGEEKAVGEFDRFATMSDKGFASAIENMPDDKFAKLMASKPPALVKKFPNAPWDD